MKLYSSLSLMRPPLVQQSLSYETIPCTAVPLLWDHPLYSSPSLMRPSLVQQPLSYETIPCTAVPLLWDHPLVQQSLSCETIPLYSSPSLMRPSLVQQSLSYETIPLYSSSFALRKKETNYIDIDKIRLPQKLIWPLDLALILRR